MTGRPNEKVGARVTRVVKGRVYTKVISATNVGIKSGIDCATAGQRQQYNRTDIDDYHEDRAGIDKSSSMGDLHWPTLGVDSQTIARPTPTRDCDATPTRIREKVEREAHWDREIGGLSSESAMMR